MWGLRVVTAFLGITVAVAVSFSVVFAAPVGVGVGVGAAGVVGGVVPVPAPVSVVAVVALAVVTVVIVTAVVAVGTCSGVGAGPEFALTLRVPPVRVADEPTLEAEFAPDTDAIAICEAGTISTSVSLIGVVHCHSSSESSTLFSVRDGIVGEYFV